MNSLNHANETWKTSLLTVSQRNSIKLTQPNIYPFVWNQYVWQIYFFAWESGESRNKLIRCSVIDTIGYCVILHYTFMLHHILFSSVMEGKERNAFVKSITIRIGWSFQGIKLEVNEYPSCSWDWSHPFILQAKLFTVKTSSYSPYNKQYANRFWQDKN